MKLPCLNDECNGTIEVSYSFSVGRHSGHPDTWTPDDEEFEVIEVCQKCGRGEDDTDQDALIQAAREVEEEDEPDDYDGPDYEDYCDNRDDDGRYYP